MPPGRIATVLNWVDTDWIGSDDVPPPDLPRLLYTGNIGYTQGFETLLESARLVGDSVEVLIVGDGNEAPNVRLLASDVSNASVRAPVPGAEYPRLLASAMAHLVLQRRVSAGANLPSKIAPYLASGRPIIGSIAPETPAAELLRASGAAVLVEPENPSALADAIRHLRDRPDVRAALGAAGREFAVRELGRERTLGRFERIVLGTGQ